LAPAQLGCECAELLLFRHVPYATATTNRQQLCFAHRLNTIFDPSCRPRRARRPHKHHFPPCDNSLRHNSTSQRHKHRHAHGRHPLLATPRDLASHRRRLRKRARRTLALQPFHKEVGNGLLAQIALAARALTGHGTERGLLLFQLGRCDRGETSVGRWGDGDESRADEARGPAVAVGESRWESLRYGGLGRESQGVHRERDEGTRGAEVA